MSSLINSVSKHMNQTDRKKEYTGPPLETAILFSLIDRTGRKNSNDRENTAKLIFLELSIQEQQNMQSFSYMWKNLFIIKPILGTKTTIPL